MMVAIKKRSFSELQETYLLARAYGDFNEAYKAIAAMKQFVQEAEADLHKLIRWTQLSEGMAQLAEPEEE